MQVFKRDAAANPQQQSKTRWSIEKTTDWCIEESIHIRKEL